MCYVILADLEVGLCERYVLLSYIIDIQILAKLTVNKRKK